MSLNRKVTLALGCLFGALLAVQTFLLRHGVDQGFERLERREAERALGRVERALAAELEQLVRQTQDWASWDDTWRFAAERNPAYAEANLLDSTWKTLDIELFLILDAGGEPIGGGWRDLATLEPLELPAPLLRGLPADHPLLRHPTPDHRTLGFLGTERGPVLVSSLPILTSNNEGPVRGTLIMGRLLGPARVARLAERVDLPLELLPDPPAGRRLQVGAESIRTEDAVNDVTGRPLFGLRLDLPRAAHAVGQETVRYTLLLMGMTAGLVLVVSVLLTRRLVVRPLTRLTRHVRRMAETGDIAVELPDRSGDEFGELADEFRRMQRRVAELAHYDLLTGLPNRVLFNERCEQAFSMARRRDTRVAVLFLDLDGFKPVNDNYGHAAGDRLLQAVGARLRAHLRGYDVLARIGGDEFVILMEDATPDGIAALAAKVVLECGRPFEIDHLSFRIGSSIGIAVYPDDGEEIDSLMGAADAAMYRAKAAGKGQYRFHSEPLLPEDSAAA